MKALDYLTYAWKEALTEEVVDTRLDSDYEDEVAPVAQSPLSDLAKDFSSKHACNSKIHSPSKSPFTDRVKLLIEEKLASDHSNSPTAITRNTL